ncbi:VanZ family protein [Arsukibacterium sp.]|uniref:VanZ family protein n=1 Tax=Arsukibacterium sp. TaxID=1977258 RepID=UPI002FD975A7
MSQRFYRWLCLLFFAIATFSFLAEISGHRIGLNISHLDKLAHFGIFAVLAWLTWKGFRPPFYWAVAILSLYGGLIELAQHYFTRRQGDVWDWLADIAGVLAFYLARKLWHLWRPRRSAKT